MQAANAVADIADRRQAVGRKDAEKQEQVIELDVLRERSDYLVQLFYAKRDAAKEFGDAVKATAEKAGLLSTVVRKFVAAKAGDDYDDAKRKADQLALVFEEIA